LLRRVLFTLNYYEQKTYLRGLEVTELKEEDVPMV